MNFIPDFLRSAPLHADSGVAPLTHEAAEGEVPQKAPQQRKLVIPTSHHELPTASTTAFGDCHPFYGKEPSFMKFAAAGGFAFRSRKDIVEELTRGGVENVNERLQAGEDIQFGEHNYMLDKPHEDRDKSSNCREVVIVYHPETLVKELVDDGNRPYSYFQAYMRKAIEEPEWIAERFLVTGKPYLKQQFEIMRELLRATDMEKAALEVIQPDLIEDFKKKSRVLSTYVQVEELAAKYPKRQNKS